MKYAPVLLALAACGPSHPTRQEHADAFISEACNRLAICDSAQASDVQVCITTAHADLGPIADPQGASTCTDADEQSCAQALDIEDCAALKAGTAPAACTCP